MSGNVTMGSTKRKYGSISDSYCIIFHLLYISLRSLLLSHSSTSLYPTLPRNSLNLNYPVSSRSRTLLLVLSLKLPSPVILLPAYALFTGSESLNSLNTNSPYWLTKFSELPNLHTFIISSLFNVLTVLALHPSLLLLGYRHHRL